jgi:hypothetical protein
MACELLPGSPGDVVGDDVRGVPVQRGAGPVQSHDGTRVSVRGGFLHVAQRHPGIQRSLSRLANVQADVAQLSSRAATGPPTPLTRARAEAKIGAPTCGQSADVANFSWPAFGAAAAHIALPVGGGMSGRRTL